MDFENELIKQKEKNLRVFSWSARIGFLVICFIGLILDNQQINVFGREVTLDLAWFLIACFAALIIAILIMGKMRSDIKKITKQTNHEAPQ